MNQVTRAEGKHQIVVRMPVSLHEALTEMATANELSVNAQVCALVENQMRRDRRKAAA